MAQLTERPATRHTRCLLMTSHTDGTSYVAQTRGRMVTPCSELPGTAAYRASLPHSR
jgi:hypothetical protein